MGFYAMQSTDLNLKTVVGLFDNLAEASQAVQELSTIGLDRQDISFIAHASSEDYHTYFDEEGRYMDEPTNHEVVSTASRTATGASIGVVFGALGGLLLGLALVPVAGFGPIVAAGPVTATLVGAIGGGIVGGLLGALTHLGVPEEHAGYYAEGVRRGGTLVIVKTVEAKVASVTDVLNRHHPVNVEERVALWRNRGWAGYDPAAIAYGPDEIAAEKPWYSQVVTVEPIGRF